MRQLDIKARVRLAALLPTALIAILQALYFYSVRNTELEASMHLRGREVAKHLASAAEYGVFSGNRESLRSLADSVLTQSELLSARIVGRNGEILAQAGNPTGLDTILSGPQAAEFASQDGMILSFRQPLPAGRQGAVFVQLHLKGLANHRQENAITALEIAAVLMLIGVLVAEFLSRGVLRPVEDIAHAVESISHGDFHVRVETRAGGALQHLAQRINEMARQLASSHDEMRRRISEATDELRLRKEEAEKANVAKSRFLASASHDLRQPMHALGLFVAQLQSLAKTSEGQHLVRQITESVRALEGLLDGLLDISKLDAGVLTPTFTNFSLSNLLTRIENDHTGPAEQKGIYLRVRRSDLWVRTDPVLLERILLNLVSNAVRYTADGGVLVVCRRRGNRVRIEVRDSGFGIPPESQDAIFQEFVQLHNPGRNRGQGLGLGLAIVKRLATLLGLNLLLISAPGRGSVFAVEVPVAEAAARTPDPAPMMPMPGGQLTGRVVVVVDDDELVLSSVTGLLESWGCQVIPANSGEQAVQRINQAGRIPDALLCDYRLKEARNGAEVVRELRMMFGRNLPAALVSGDTAPEVLRMAREAGLALLHKPVAPAKLRTLLQRLLMKTPPGGR